MVKSVWMNRERLYEKLLTMFSYVWHLLLAKHRYGHGVHSPFAFEFINKVVFDHTSYSEYKSLQVLRNELKRSDIQLQVQEVGSGSTHFSGKSRKVSDLIHVSSVNRKNGKLLFRISRNYKPATIIELGTSIGLSSLYLAKGSPVSRVVTVEGNPELSQFAAELFKKCNTENITPIIGLFDEQLELLKQKYPVPQLVFIDGNHNVEATLRYYRHFSEQMNSGILIFDDINWSRNMRKAWKEIRQDRSARATIDLFYMGIVLLDQSITPGHYRVRF
jgi:predicted O-methyltransferase YrrM